MRTSERLLLDTGILGRLCHPRVEQHGPFSAWLARQLERRERVTVMLSEIADYELRRKLLHLSRKASRSREDLNRLDRLADLLVYLPLSTPVMRLAAQIWGDARAAGLPTATDAELDGDVILAAQARTVDGVVVTMNVRHLSRFVQAKDWETIQAEEL